MCVYIYIHTYIYIPHFSRLPNRVKTKPILPNFEKQKKANLKEKEEEEEPGL